ncbi:hypothetical protein BJX76DRAFT_325398 [Aspergillus varians]
MDTEDNAPPSPTHDPNCKTEPSTKPIAPDPDDHTAHQSKSKGRFRFKSKSKSKSSSRSSHHDSHRHRHSHRHRRDDDEPRDEYRRRHKRRRTTTRSPSPGTVPSYPGPPLSPNTAFRESLFDALGDDEGAAFWESVYGQSVHSFAVPPGHRDGAEGDGMGKLEQMDEDEYAAYVRGEMWKRTREGMLEEQERIRAEKKARVRAEKAAGENEERRKFERAMEDSLRRGQTRKRMKEVWKEVWVNYLDSWEKIESIRNKGEGEKGDTKGEGKNVRSLLFWPVESGKRRDVTRENVEEFMRRAPPQLSAAGNGSTPEDLLLSMLKVQRVRWHPDKIQHRYGALGIDESVMRSVTEVFQIIDHMWNELKK